MRVVSGLLFIAGIAGLIFMVVGAMWLSGQSDESTRVLAFFASLAVLLLSVLCIALSVFFDKVGMLVDRFGPMFEGFRPQTWRIDTFGKADLEMRFDPEWATAHIKRKYEEGS